MTKSNGWPDGQPFFLSANALARPTQGLAYGQLGRPTDGQRSWRCEGIAYVKFFNTATGERQVSDARIAFGNAFGNATAVGLSIEKALLTAKRHAIGVANLTANCSQICVN